MSAEGRPHIVVVGSINMDLVARVAHLPRPGETVSASTLVQNPGGKGANQAVAVARMGARCSMIGRVGDDGFGPVLLEGLREYGVETEAVKVTPGCSSGVALIGVEESGQNAITVVPGANGRLTEEDIYERADLIRSADALLVQLEVPLETVEAAIRIARMAFVKTILDPAPAPLGPLPRGCLDVDVLSPNESECMALAKAHGGGSEASADRPPIPELDPRLGPTPQYWVVKLGARGAALGQQKPYTHWFDWLSEVRAAAVEAVDTTAAGDAFSGALAVSMAEGRAMSEAVRIACAAGTLATTRLGAQQAMPTRDEVFRFLETMP